MGNSMAPMKGKQNKEGSSLRASQEGPAPSGFVGYGAKNIGSGGLPSLFNAGSSADILEYKTGDANCPAYSCSSVQGKRVGMEDEHIAVRPLFCAGGEVLNLFGVFDGHGGTNVAGMLNLHSYSSYYAVCDHSTLHAFTMCARCAHAALDTGILSGCTGRCTHFAR